MINGITVKICGLTTRRDADSALKIGADYLAFNFHPASPRATSLENYARFANGLSGTPKVAVLVEPRDSDLGAFVQAGFGFFQVHFRHDLSLDIVKGWSSTLGPERLWLAPKLPPSVSLPASLLPLASTFLLDTFDPVKFGGTGRIGDWSKFARHQREHPEKTWILSGGLNPENISEAVRASGAKFVDVNSGVESAPGVKDPAKLTALAAALAK